MNKIEKIAIVLMMLVGSSPMAAYIKVAANGDQLSDTALEWSCIYDDVNHLLWESKNNDGGLHDRDHKGRWGGRAEHSLGGANYGEWDVLIDGTNSELLCGQSGWKVPTIDELGRLVTTESGRPMIDLQYFPHNRPSNYWSTSTNGDAAEAEQIRFTVGGGAEADTQMGRKSYYEYVRLVRSGSLLLSFPIQAQFLLTPTTGVAPLLLAFDASATTGNDGTSGSIRLYHWNSSGGQTATGSSGSMELPDPGNYTIDLMVIDDIGRSANSSQEVTIFAVDPNPNQPPDAHFTVTPTTGEIPLVVFLDGRGSTDGDGNIAYYQWSATDGQSVMETVSSSLLTFTTVGSHNITLTVIDNDGGNASANHTVVALLNTEPPIAEMAVRPVSGLTPLTVFASGTASSDPDGTIVAYQWTTSDGQSANESSKVFNFNQVGVHTLTLTVMDDKGATASVLQEITALSGNETTSNTTTNTTTTMSAIYNATTATIYLPVIDVLDASGGNTSYRANMTQVPLSDPLQFQINDESLEIIMEDGGFTHSIYSAGTLRIPTVGFNEMLYQVEMDLIDVDQLTFELTEASVVGDWRNSTTKYVKLGVNGRILHSDADDWRCVGDTETGLLWEVKTDDGGFHDRGNSYRWGGGVDAGTMYNYGDWDALVNTSDNELLCGESGWRVPEIDELAGLIDTGQGDPVIDTALFPNTQSSDYWSATSSSSGTLSIYGWSLNFSSGYSGSNFKYSYKGVRLVQGDYTQ